ncbi:PaaI family thioesterase [Parvularcula sp. LCG005]|uniref:PaaI family thioesterase n=1 Tax=Parvularcula sp. LCG005 TaxID=3078805 RepID=UPI002942A5A6|nr:PaaI family thioesterase [Parvularcula sp. LCG005]WOI54646.1 PaaI family thioesterase [Parvularcula sp. LCG005]
MADDKTTIAPAIAQALAFAEKHMQSEHKLFRDIPMRTTSVGVGSVAVEITLPAAFADDDETFGGLYTILLDTILAVGAWTRMDAFAPLSTINLKTDFFSPATTGNVVLCEAECDGIIDNVAVCSGRMTRDGQLAAKAQGTFLVSRPDGSATGSRL